MAEQEDDAGSVSETPPTERPIRPHLGAIWYLDAAWGGGVRSNGGLARRDDPAILSGVVQDLSGPLTALLTSTGVVAQDVGELPAEKRYAIQSMQRRGFLLQSRLENLLCAAAIWEGSFQIHRRSIALGDIVAEVRLAAMPLLEDRSQRLDVSAHSGENHVSADPRRVAQILINLILNASEYGGERSTIGIHMRPGESSVHVSVVDRGPGISGERLPSVFDLFHPSLLAVGPPGIALGLGIVRAVVEAHGGKAGVRNRRSGGARVWFEVPRAN